MASLRKRIALRTAEIFLPASAMYRHSLRRRGGRPLLPFLPQQRYLVERPGMSLRDWHFPIQLQGRRTKSRMKQSSSAASDLLPPLCLPLPARRALRPPCSISGTKPTRLRLRQQEPAPPQADSSFEAVEPLLFVTAVSLQSFEADDAALAFRTCARMLPERSRLRRVMRRGNVVSQTMFACSCNASSIRSSFDRTFS